MWEVIQERTMRGPRYVVENQDTGEVHGTHDCQRWAEAVAQYLNERDEHDKRRSDKVARKVASTGRRGNG